MTTHPLVTPALKARLLANVSARPLYDMLCMQPTRDVVTALARLEGTVKPAETPPT
jgi:hypothetical protein